MSEQDLVAGRYRLGAALADDVPRVTTVRAVDEILDRTVRVRLLPADRTGVLDAARRAALVTDARLARVLDVGSLRDGRGFVVGEHVDGPTLGDLLADGPLTPDQARSLVGETAAAVEVARRRGVHHLSLRPSVVRLGPDGRVVLDGLALDAAMVGRSQGDDAASRTDASDLVRLLYAALTATWPDAPGGWVDDVLAPVGLPAAASTSDGAPVPPDVPDEDLRTLCHETLGRAGRGPRTAGDVVRALEPWGEIRVGAGPVAPAPDARPAAPTTVAGAPATVPPAPPAVLPTTPEPAPAPWDAARPSGDHSAADTAPVPVVVPSSYGRPRRRLDLTRLAVLVLVLVLVVAVVLGIAQIFLHTAPAVVAPTASSPIRGTTTTSTPAGTPSPSVSTGTPSATGTGTPVIASVVSVDPAGPGGEHEELVGRLFDGDPGTSWHTRTYRNAAFGGLKQGVGLVVTLASPATVREVTLVTAATGGQVQIRALDPSSATGGTVLAAGALTGTTVFTLSPVQTASTGFVVWISQLPTSTDGSYRLDLGEIEPG